MASHHSNSVSQQEIATIRDWETTPKPAKIITTFCKLYCIGTGASYQTWFGMRMFEIKVNPAIHRVLYFCCSKRRSHHLKSTADYKHLEIVTGANVQSLRGSVADFIVLDEYFMLSQSLFNKVILPLMGIRDVKIVILR
jgi:hypothetical protein